MTSCAGDADGRAVEASAGRRGRLVEARRPLVMVGQVERAGLQAAA